MNMFSIVPNWWCRLIEMHYLLASDEAWLAQVFVEFVFTGIEIFVFFIFYRHTNGFSSLGSTC
jgi:hypothetical protein